MNSARTREDAKKRWVEIVAELEAEKQKIVGEIDQLRAEKDKLVITTKAANTRAGNIESLESRASDSLDVSNKIMSSVESSKAAVYDLIKKIGKLSSDVEMLQKKAQQNSEVVDELLSDADRAAISGDFKHYADKYGNRANLYTGFIVVCVGILVWTLVFLFPLPEKIELLDLLFFGLKKIAIATPFVYLIYLFTRIQSEARNREGQYRFKSAVALSLKANKELLADLYGKDYSVKDGEKNIYPVAEFAKGVIIDKIYSFPEQGGNAAKQAEVKATFWTSRSTKKALSLLREFSEIIKNSR